MIVLKYGEIIKKSEKILRSIMVFIERSYVVALM